MAQQIPKGYFAKNIDAVGYHDLNGKPAFKLALQEKNHRWYLYAIRPRRNIVLTFLVRKTPGRFRSRWPMAK